MSQPATTPAGSGTATSAYRLIVGWFLLILLLAAASQTRLGYMFVYYFLLLALILLLVTHSQNVTALLRGVNQPLS